MEQGTKGQDRGGNVAGLEWRGERRGVKETQERDERFHVWASSSDVRRIPERTQIPSLFQTVGPTVPLKGHPVTRGYRGSLKKMRAGRSSQEDPNRRGRYGLREPQFEGRHSLTQGAPQSEGR